MFDKEKKIVYSGMQPTGCITIGNYIGAINNWLKMQDDYNCIFSIVDLHCLTVRQQPAELRGRVLSFFAQYIAAGIDPKKSILYFQSQVHEHSELTWILNCYSYIGELERMTQFKDKSLKNESNINMGLMDYPVLMAADILLYQTSLVPVGVDQKQHLEFARDIAIRFNNIYNNVFTVPEPYIPKQGAKILSLADPESKMSKSDPNENGAISIIDAPDVIMRKIRRAVTDSDMSIRYDTENKKGVSNLLTIYSAMTDSSIEKAEEHFQSKDYKSLKEEVGSAIVERLKPLQSEYNKLMQDKAYLLSIAEEGRQAAALLASRTLAKVYKKIGLIR